MPTVEIKQLYNLSRFPQSGSQVLSLVAYFPFGVVLLLGRSILGALILLCGYILPNADVVRNILHRLICLTLGISVNVENNEKKEEVEAFVSNQISVLDHLALTSVTGCVTPGIKLTPLLSKCLGLQNFGPSSNVETIKKHILEVVSENKSPLFFQPENMTTNGKGLLKFNTWPFEVCSKIQPVAIKTSRPIIDIPVTAIDSSYWRDILFYLFTPCTVYHIRFLPASEKKGITETDLTEKIRSDIASALKIQPVDYNANDLKEWEKRYKSDQIRVRQPGPSNLLGTNPELHRMSLQVREVLPLVPYNVVYKDLLKTRNVDVTITNILEGHIPYTPEPQPPQSGPSTSQTERSSNASSSQLLSKPTPSTEFFNTAASSFGKNAHERALSFQERKQLLIENARKRYIEKHGLNNLVLNNC